MHKKLNRPSELPACGIVLLICFIFFSAVAMPASAGERYANTGYFELKNAIISEAGIAYPDNKKKYDLSMAITSHHLPAALPLISGLYRAIAHNSGSRKVFVVIGPDHFEKCSGNIATAIQDFRTPFGILEPDEKLVKELEKNGFSDDDACIASDHTVRVQAAMLKYYFPDAKIVPLLVSAFVKQDEMDKLFRVLSAKKDSIFILGSIDFSHHNSPSMARKIDNFTAAKIRKLDPSGLTLKNADSPATLGLLLKIARASGKKADIIDQKNSYDFTGNNKNTTGYLSVIFRK